MNPHAKRAAESISAGVGIYDTPERWISVIEIAIEEDRAAWQAHLKDPATVLVNILRGEIALPSCYVELAEIAKAQAVGEAIGAAKAARAQVLNDKDEPVNTDEAIFERACNYWYLKANELQRQLENKGQTKAETWLSG